MERRARPTGRPGELSALPGRCTARLTDAQIRDLLDRGARLVDVGQQSDVSWTVLADPEGNEFCVLSARDM